MSVQSEYFFLRQGESKYRSLSSEQDNEGAMRSKEQNGAYQSVLAWRRRKRN